MSYVIYELVNGRRYYLTDIPEETNLLGGIGYRGTESGEIPQSAGTCPTEEDAKKVCEWLRDACYGPPREHFYEKAPSASAGR